MEQRQAGVARAVVRVLVIGASGLVGQALMRAAPAATGTYRTRALPGLRRLDAADAAATARLVEEVAPDVILCPAAQPDVEWCERHPDEARDANLAPLRSVLRTGVPVVAFSSDYVFDGRAGPYAEDARRSPLSVYGAIKVALEDETLAAGGTVVRTTGVFGGEAPPGKNFVLRAVRTLTAGGPLVVPADQIATPTYADDLARATHRVAERGGGGLWHVGGPDLLSRLELGRLVAEVFGLDPSLVRGTSTAALGQAAARPLRGGLRNTRYRDTFGADPVRPVRAALEQMRRATRDSLPRSELDERSRDGEAPAAEGEGRRAR